MTYLASQRWGDLGVPREVAIPALCDFVEVIAKRHGGEGEKAVVNAFYQLQLNLMARQQGGGDMLSLQRHPAFSITGQFNLSALIYSYLSGGKSEVMREARSRGEETSFIDSDEFSGKAFPAVAVRFGDNRGDSEETAVVIHMPPPDELMGLENLSLNVLGVHSEYWYLCYKHGYLGKDWTMEAQASSRDAGKVYDILTFSRRRGGPNRFYFNITEFFGRG